MLLNINPAQQVRCLYGLQSRFDDTLEYDRSSVEDEIVLRASSNGVPAKIFTPILLHNNIIEILNRGLKHIF